jgi:transmembrane sensor
MNESHEHIPDELLARYLANTATAGEIEEVRNWLSRSPENEQELAAFETLWERSAALKTRKITADTDAAWKKVRLRMDVKSGAEPVNEAAEPAFHEEVPVKKLPVSKTVPVKFWIAAAVSLTLMAFGWFVFKTQFSNPEMIQVATTNNTREATLPDGTKVFLNYNSRIRYPENFNEAKRSVALEGEAFFDVKRDVTHPFVIDANGTRVQVLGTSFNVKAYKKELVRVDVKTGKVMVSKADKKIEVIKGESVEVKDDTLRSLQADLNRMGYHTQVFDFNGANLGDIISSLKEGYHTDIRLANAGLARCRLTISFQKEPLDATLSVIAETLDLRVRKEGKTYWLEGNSCQ